MYDIIKSAIIEAFSAVSLKEAIADRISDMIDYDEIAWSVLNSRDMKGLVHEIAVEHVLDNL